MIPLPRNSSDEPSSPPPVDDRWPCEDGASGDGLGDLSLDDLRRQRSLLAEELRGVRYWRRIAQAQTDLLVASLLHAGREDLDGLHGVGLPGGGSFDPCDRLLQLRERNELMAGYERGLQADHDAVVRELAGRVAGLVPEPVSGRSPTTAAS